MVFLQEFFNFIITNIISVDNIELTEIFFFDSKDILIEESEFSGLMSGLV